MAGRLPGRPPPGKLAPLFGQSAAVVLLEPIEGRAVAGPLRRLRPLQPRAKIREPLAGDVAVVGAAEDVLHLHDAWVDFLAECGGKAALEQLHRVAHLLAADA